MTEENQNNQAVTDQATEVGSTLSEEKVDWEKKYHEEVNQSKSYRARAQTAEGKLEKSTKESESKRKQKMEEDGKLKELLAEQDKVIEVLRSKAEAGDQLLKDQHAILLEQLPKDDREDFSDLPINQLRKVVAKFKVAETVKPEIPSVKGAVKGSDKPSKNFWTMSKEYQEANWDDTVDGYIERKKLNNN